MRIAIFNHALVVICILITKQTLHVFLKAIDECNLLY